MRLVIKIIFFAYLNCKVSCFKIRSQYRQRWRLKYLSTLTPCYNGVRRICPTQSYEGLISSHNYLLSVESSHIYIIFEF